MPHQLNYQPQDGLPPSAFQHSPTPYSMSPVETDHTSFAYSASTTGFAPYTTPGFSDRSQQLCFIKARLEQMGNGPVMALDTDDFKYQANLLTRWIYDSQMGQSTAEQSFVVDAVENLLRTFMNRVALKAVPEWAVSLHESPCEHPEASKVVHKALHAICIARRNTVDEPHLANRVALIIEQYRARRPFRINAHAGHSDVKFGQLDFVYQLPALEIPHPSPVDPMLARKIGDYRTGLQFQNWTIEH
ncbi:hypothetical protein HWV62_20854 [Athelia sp. TMB]|nr:hypothetical protein HWV62_29735 [Athelia sp. TMB]KAF7971541.1 hypothetical protein HWV62_20854 [Athelia sp. TMB]